MRVIDLFSGIGGFAFAASQVWGDDLEIVNFVEIDEYCQKVLNKNFPGVPIESDIKKYSARERGAIDLITGGFPCQPFSSAGKQKGSKDDRNLWPEMFRIIQEAKPTWVIGENVANFINFVEFENALLDLEGEGYEVQTFIIPALSVGAPHRRDRVWIVAQNTHNSRSGGGNYGNSRRSKRKIQASRPNTSFREYFTNTHKFNDDDGRLSTSKISQLQATRVQWAEKWHEVATKFCRVDDGISNRVDGLRSLGNAIVPQVVIPIMESIKRIENG